jgi:hypothetical protein
METMSITLVNGEKFNIDNVGSCFAVYNHRDVNSVLHFSDMVSAISWVLGNKYKGWE